MVPLSRPAAWGLSGKRRGATQPSVTSETTRAMLDARCNGACLLDARADELAISSGVGRPGGIIKRAAVDIKIRASATGIAPHSQRCVWHRRVWYRPAGANFRARPTPLLLHWAGRVLMPRRPRSGRLLAIDLVVLDHADRRHVIDLLQRKRASAVQTDDLSLRMHDRAAHDGHACLHASMA